MNEKDKAIQEENKAVQDGIMSDDELDTVAGGVSSIVFANPENDVTCGCLDGMTTSSRSRYVCDCMDGEGGSSWGRRPGSIISDINETSNQSW